MESFSMATQLCSSVSSISPSVSPAPIPNSNSSQSSSTVPEVSSSIAETAEEDWDSDRTISDAEMLHEHIFGATRFRTVEDASTTASGDSVPKPGTQDPASDSQQSLKNESILPKSISSNQSVSSSIKSKGKRQKLATVSAKSSDDLKNSSNDKSARLKRSENPNSVAVSSKAKRRKVSKLSEKSSQKSLTRSKRNARSFKCAKCQKSFPTVHYLKKHRNTCGQIALHNLKYKCVECSVTYEMSRDLDIHMKGFHGGYKCENCVPERRFPTIGQANTHMRNNVCNRLQCTQCEMKFWSMSLRETHVMELHGGHKCTKCHKTFSHIKQLQDHRRQTVCVPTENTKSKPTKSVLLERSDNPISAGVSSKSKRQKVSKIQLKSPDDTHKRSKHKSVYVKPSSFECAKCKKSFPARDDLRKHLGDCGKLGMKKYSCDECSVTSQTRSALNNHMREIHGGHKCENCVPERRFSAKKEANTHMRKNVCNRFQCMQCEMKFWIASLRDTHILEVHGGHKCESCVPERLFSTEWDAKVHMRKNVCNRFQCTQCEMKFWSTSHRETHVMQVHGGHKCINCQKSFTKFVLLRNHLWRVPCGEHLYYRYVKKAHTAKSVQQKKKNVVHVAKHVQQKNENLLHVAKPELKKESVKRDDAKPVQPKNENVLHVAKPAHPKKENILRVAKPELKKESVLRDDAKPAQPTKEKSLRFKCEVCDKQFSRRQIMHTHMCEVHGGYKCKVCVPARMFSTDRALKRHTEKTICMKWKCPDCAIAFAFRPLLETHIKDFHRGSKCVKCQRMFGSVYALRKHCDRCPGIETTSKLVG
eukprot:566530_1